MQTYGGKAETPEERVARWLADGDTVICIFENQDLGSGQVGHRFAMPFSVEAAAKMEIGKVRGPDTHFGAGWRYLLSAKTTDASEALSLVKWEEGAR